MKKNLSSAKTVNKSSGLQVVDVIENRQNNGKVSNKPNLLENSANVLDETESIKKSETFSKVRDLFGFSKFDKESFAKSLAMDLANGVISYAEFASKMSKENKAVNSENESLENLTFEDVCGKIQDSDLLPDVARYVGTTDLLSLKNLLISGESVVLYHGKQSEDGERFEVCKVTVKGKHKPYTDICYTSTDVISTSNIIRALRSYGYYLASLNRCYRQRKAETDLLTAFISIRNRLHKEFGYMPDDFAEI